MLKIKLARFGKKHQPHYRIVVNEARDKRDGRYVALVGRYTPTAHPKELVIDVKVYQDWLSKGAQPTDTVAALFKRFQSGNPFPEKAVKLSKKAKAKLSAAKEAKAEAVQPVVEAAAESAKPEEPIALEETPVEEAKTELNNADEKAAQEEVPQEEATAEDSKA